MLKSFLSLPLKMLRSFHYFFRELVPVFNYSDEQLVKIAINLSFLVFIIREKFKVFSAVKTVKSMNSLMDTYITGQFIRSQRNLNSLNLGSLSSRVIIFGEKLI